jgi:N-sulfoglucosamine sulfohydrolase
MVSWLDITPTLLDFAHAVPEKPKYQGRSFKDIIGNKATEGWDKIYASQTFHEITMYYPMRVVRTDQYKLIWNIAHRLEFPFASDLWDSLTWQAMLKKTPDTLYGPRTIDAYIHRPEFELYDMQNDPKESRNLAENPEFKAVLDGLRADLQNFQQETGDPWYIKWQHE